MILQDYKLKLAIDYDAKHKAGTEIRLMELLDPKKDCWEFSRTDKKGNEFKALIIKHYKVQEIKRYAGLKIHNDPKLIVSPSIQNNMTAAWQGSLKLPTERKKKVDDVIGEANSTSATIAYVVTMAYKRWFDRAVLDCMEMFEAYSDSEAEQFEAENVNEDVNKPVEIHDLKIEQVQVIQPFVKTINEMKDDTMLEEYGKSLEVLVKNAKVDEKAKAVLRNIYQKKLSELKGTSF